MRAFLNEYLGNGAVALVVAAGVVVGGIAAGCEPAEPFSPHPYDMVPGPDDIYVPNEAVSLLREYWVVFREPSGTHYMFPRPDGEPLLSEPCTGDDSLAQLLRGARMCDYAGSSQDVDRVNSLSHDEAMQVSTYLHAQLRFEAAEGDTQPHALISDVIDVCRTNAEARSGTLRSVCDRELSWAEDGSRPSVFNPLTAEEASALAGALNGLYGIPNASAR